MSSKNVQRTCEYIAPSSGGRARCSLRRTGSSKYPEDDKRCQFMTETSRCRIKEQIDPKLAYQAALRKYKRLCRTIDKRILRDMETAFEEDVASLADTNPEKARLLNYIILAARAAHGTLSSGTLKY